MTESNAWLLILKLPFLCFSGVATASNLSVSALIIVCHHVGIPTSLVFFLRCFYILVEGLSWLFHQASIFSKNSLHDYEENESSHLCCTLIVRKNLTAVSKGCDS